MALITLRQLLDHAAENGYGVPAFNINNMEQGLAIVKAAAATDAPVILQASRGARSYAGDIMLRHMVQALTEMFPDTHIVMHQDHGNNDATCLSAIRHGFTSVMMDGSLEEDMKTPSSFDYNVEITERVTKAAHAVGASVEGELGVLGSLESGEAAAEDGSGAEGKLSHDQLLTDPDQAVDFVTRTKVDALAIACGTSHGAYKFSRKPDGDILSMSTIAAIHEKLPNTHLVMHGSSSVPQYLQDLINAYGGDMSQTYGVPVEEIERGIKMGVRKVNIDTDGRLVWTRVHREFFRDKPGDFDFRPPGKIFIEEYAKFIASRNVLLGSANQLTDLRASLGA
jgi:fructose-bisphosphate aldolase class II